MKKNRKKKKKKKKKKKTEKNIIEIMAIQCSLGFVVSSMTRMLDSKTFVPSIKPIPIPSINRKNFPDGFVFGTGSSAYQYEGAIKEGGKGPSIWDTFTQDYPDRIVDGSNGEIAEDFYHRYKEDVQYMKGMGMDSFRFSISWSRILPRGNLKGGVSDEGIKFYKDLISELLDNDLEPFVTIFHWDLPQTLEVEYGGFLSDKIVDDFRDFAELCFKEFGDKVKFWTTFNEPYAVCCHGFDLGCKAPGRCSKYFNEACQAGDSSTEPYIVAHNILLSHAASVKLYREKYQKIQKGKIGMTLVSHWFEPLSSADNDKDAAQRSLDFMFGWFLDPLTNGDYPKSMKDLVKERLPKFTEEQSEELKGSLDFLGLNYYTAYYASQNSNPDTEHLSYSTDSLTTLSVERDGKLIGPQAGSTWLHICPNYFHNLLIYTKEKYNNPAIYITENGVDELNNSKITLPEALDDRLRIDFHNKHLSVLQKSITNEGVNVKGYFVWSLLDNFEWESGYTSRFGIYYVDFNNGLKRYPKLSESWFKKFLKK